MYNSSVTSIYTPESFTIYPGAERDLENSFVQGKRIAAEKGIIFTGLLRDAGKAIPAIRKKVEQVGSKFKNYRVLLVENNSKDGTREKLLQWAKENPRVTILGCGVNVEECSIQGAASGLLDLTGSSAAGDRRR